MATLERIYTIPMKGAYDYVRTKRARRAVKLVREFALRHMKAGEAWISQGVNSLIFQNGMQKPPRRLKVRIAKGDDALAKVWLVGEEEKIKEAESKKKTADEAKAAEEKKKEEARKQAAEKAKEEKKSAEAAKAGEKKNPQAGPATPAQAAKPPVPEAKPAVQAARPASPAAQPAKK